MKCHDCSDKATCLVQVGVEETIVVAHCGKCRHTYHMNEPRVWPISSLDRPTALDEIHKIAVEAIPPTGSVLPVTIKQMAALVDSLRVIRGLSGPWVLCAESALMQRLKVVQSHFNAPDNRELISCMIEMLAKIEANSPRP